MKPENSAVSASGIEPARNGHRTWIWVGVGLAAAMVVAAAFLPPLREPQAFRTYADGRTYAGIPNFLNVVSNLAFLVVGAWGLYLLAAGRAARNAFAQPVEKWPYATLFLGVALTSIGSAYYHLAPDAARLVWDRLPMTFAFTSLAAAAIVERISVSAGVRMLVPLLAMGVASVAYWRWSVVYSSENLWPYALVQYGSIAAVVAIAMRFPSRYTRGRDVYAAAAFYAAAKAAETLDAQIYALGQIVSGHTLKHLLAALAIYWLLRMLRLREIR